MKKSNPHLRYSEEFKRTVVEEIETGIMSVSEARRYYGIEGTMTVYRWIATYGMNDIKGRKVIVMSKKEETELITLRRQLAEASKALEDAECRAIAWESMVEAIEKDLGMPVKKKPWNLVLQEAKRKLNKSKYSSRSKNTVEYMGSANKDSISVARPIRRK